MPHIDAKITLEFGKPYILTLVSGKTVRFVIQGSRWSRNGDVFDIEVDGKSIECWTLNEIAGDFSLVANG